MVYRNFRFNILIRLLIVVITVFFLFFTFYETKYLTIPVLLLIFLSIQVFFMIKYLEKSHRTLTSFLESIRYNDFSRSFEVEGLGRSYDALKIAFNDVIKDFQKIRAEKEEQYYFLQTLVQHVGICLIAYHRDGEVFLMNNAAQKLIHKKNLKNINQIDGKFNELPKALLELGNGEKRVLKIYDDKDILQLVVYVTEFKLQDEHVKLASVQNIQSELDEQEMEAWQKLIRVLTHEIMNSITPIASITTTVNGMISDVKESGNEIDEELINDIQQGLQTINKRSNGLIHFVQTYRNLTKIPKPSFSVYPVIKLFNHVESVFEAEINEANIQFDIQMKHERLEMTADIELVEQILINLIKNSIHALKGRQNPRIILEAYMNELGRIVITVSDNGPGILTDVLDKIFIPFFTTKPSGSGIGLSLSRQIMRQHGGTITAYSEPDKETSFVLRF